MYEKYSHLPTGNVCDANTRQGNMDTGIKPVSSSMKVIGKAFTLRCQPGDNLSMHHAIYQAPKGSVIVIDMHNHTQAGAFGDIMANACLQAGVAGVVMNGCCRDAEDLETLGFPVFSRGLNPGGTVKYDTGVMGQPIECGGVIVNPGDLIFADRDGVVVIKATDIDDVLERALSKNKKEDEIKMLLKSGKTTLEIYGF